MANNIFNEIADIFRISDTLKLDVSPFKPKSNIFTIKTGVGVQIHPFSKSLENFLANDDAFEKIGYQDFLNKMQVVTIREFSPQDKINYAASWFDKLGKGFEDAQKDGPGISLGALAEKAKQWIKDKNHGLLSLPDKIIAAARNSVPFTTSFGGEHVDDFFKSIPYILYYRLTTTTTTGIYELPYNNSNDFFKSDGTYGWKQGGDIIGQLLGGNAIGKFISNTFKVRCNVAPSFSPNGETPSQEIKVSFQLINDTDEAAVNNYLFVFSLLGRNKWVQYGFVQSSASLYDIQIPGGMRYMMCMGRFECKIKGSLRRPSAKIVSSIKGYANSGFGGSMTADKISIPDAYDLTLSFTSLLPDNLNNFVYSFATEQANGSGTINSYKQSLSKNPPEFEKDESIMGKISKEFSKSIEYLSDPKSVLDKDVEEAKEQLDNAMADKNFTSEAKEAAQKKYDLAVTEREKWVSENPPPPDPPAE